MKEKVAKQLNKNKELLAEAVVNTPVDEVDSDSKTVLGAMNFAPIVGMSWEGEEKKLLDLFSVFDKREPFVDGSAPKVKDRKSVV